MRKLTQAEILSEGFWNLHQSPILKGIGKVARAGVKGIAKGLDYVAPEITQPLHALEKGARDVGQSIKQGWQGTEGYIKSVLKDKGYEVIKMTKSGKNYVVDSYVIDVEPTTGKPTRSVDNRGNTRVIRKVVDENGNDVNTAARQTASTINNAPQGPAVDRNINQRLAP